jgi:hypothetical protein
MNAFTNVIEFCGPALEHDSQARSLLKLVLTLAASAPDPLPNEPSTPEGVLKRLATYDPSGKAVSYLRRALFSAVAEVAEAE